MPTLLYRPEKNTYCCCEVDKVSISKSDTGGPVVRVYFPEGSIVANVCGNFNELTAALSKPTINLAQFQFKETDWLSLEDLKDIYKAFTESKDAIYRAKYNAAFMNTFYEVVNEKISLNAFYNVFSPDKVIEILNYILPDYSIKQSKVLPKIIQ